jgi:magnesium transporter
MTTTVRCLSRPADPAGGAALDEEDVPLEELRDRLSRRDGPFLWLDVEQHDPHRADASESARIIDALGLPPSEIEGILGARARPKAVRHHRHLAFVVYAPIPVGESARAARGEDPEAPDEQAPAPRRGEDQFCAARLAGFVHPGGLVTVRSGAPFPLEAVRDAWSEEEAGRLRGSGLVHLLLDQVVDAQFWAVQWMDDRLDDLEDRVFEIGGRGGGIEAVAAALRTEQTRLRRWIQPMSGVIDRLRPDADDDAGSPSAPSSPPAPSSVPAPPAPAAAPSRLFELQSLHVALADHAARTEEWLATQHETLSGIVETHLALQDQHLNVVMRRLAGWAAVISVPTLVTGWFGMNVPYPGSGTGWGLALATALVIVPAAALGILLRRARWI